MMVFKLIHDDGREWEGDCWGKRGHIFYDIDDAKAVINYLRKGWPGKMENFPIITIMWADLSLWTEVR